MSGVGMVTGTSDALLLIQNGKACLEEHGVPNARHNAEWILGHILGCSRAELYINSPQKVDRLKAAKFDELISRRAAREPLQYILGSMEFMSLPFAVSPGVFIPRFETEILVERTEEMLVSCQSGKRIEVLDLCSGSGPIAIALARRHRNVYATGIDTSGEAVKISRENARLNDVSSRVEFIQGDAVSFLANEGSRFDVIISNPPYIKTDEVSSLPPEVRQHEPLLSIDGGPDGLGFYRRVIPLLARRLNSEGFAAFEIGADQGVHVAGLLSEAALEGVRIFKDYSNIDRVAVGFLPDICSR